ncbi:thiamine-phosphate pyrophosphorylase [Chryseobacterium sp. H1D6B]|uniref:thiamine phosphate synthase n=1 Tax=Chryseobacterium sp. H1D6B TaxID=2940588 RepID=UPI0015CD5F81|nr:thiamine phosphate synthase [Chryseobacterium sp. H1D6B]MDH6251371.1 thiamine-phosphate pyrophosphorylase [Chryseobacterium sp. H1D6B]
MIIVITPEVCIPDETKWINQMFQEGLDLMHIRKPFITDTEMETFINQLDRPFLSKLVVHSHYDLAEKWGISRLHFREEDRLDGSYVKYAENKMISTSVHSIDAYNVLGKEWEYAFLSPVFPSISKNGYGLDKTILEDLKHRNNPNVKLIGLGGINKDTIREVFDKGADGAALLGTVWQDSDPLNAFKKCRDAVSLYQ